MRVIPIGLRNLVELAGGASTKPHPRFATAQVVITMGDIMYDKALIAALGPLGDRLSLLIATLYADPRVWNIRNDLAHGLIAREVMTLDLIHWLVHSIILIGVIAAPNP